MKFIPISHVQQVLGSNPTTQAIVFWTHQDLKYIDSMQNPDYKTFYVNWSSGFLCTVPVLFYKREKKCIRLLDGQLLMRPVMVFSSFYLPITISNWAILHKIQIVRICNALNTKQGVWKNECILYCNYTSWFIYTYLVLQYLIMIVILKCFQNIFFCSSPV